MRRWPPATSWYSRESAQQTRSGSRRGTETASRPPGRSTRTSSSIAAPSSGTCSSVSEQITRSIDPPASGRRVTSPAVAR